MKKKLYSYTLLIITILPVFSMNTMDQNTASNSNTSEHSSIVTTNQQVSEQTNNQNSTQKNRGLIGGALRLAYKTFGAYDMHKELIGLRSQEERNNSLVIYKQYNQCINDNSKTVDHLLQKQIDIRRDYATTLTEQYIELFKKNNFDEQDIEDASAILQLKDLNFLVPNALVEKLRDLVDEATEKQITNLTQLRQAIKSREPKSEIAQIQASSDQENSNEASQQQPNHPLVVIKRDRAK